MHIRLNPYDPNIAGYYWALGSSNLIAGEIDEAALLLSKARAANPRLYFVHLWLAAPLALKGDLDGARTALAESIKLSAGYKFDRGGDHRVGQNLRRVPSF